MNCNFCQKRDYLLENTFAYAIFDSNPTCEGHMLILPKRHVKEYGHLTEQEKIDMYQLVNMAKDILSGIYNQNDYSLSMNICENHGQVEHLCFNVIPKYVKFEVENEDLEEEAV